MSTSPDLTDEIDWIRMNPEIDFSAIFSQFDAALIGHRTFETMVKSCQGLLPQMDHFVFSRTLRQSEYPKVTVVAEKPERTLAALRAKPAQRINLKLESQKVYKTGCVSLLYAIT